MDDHLVSVSTWAARPGREAELERIGAEAMAAADAFEGNLGATVLREPDSAEFHIVQKFRGRAEFERWLDSAERRRLLERLEAAGERVGRPQRLTGLETWFASSGREVETIKPPPRWKMWLASFLGAYPLVALFQWQVAPELEDVPLLLRSAIFPLVLLSLMTYAVMPVVTKLLHRWLYP